MRKRPASRGLRTRASAPVRGAGREWWARHFLQLVQPASAASAHGYEPETRCGTCVNAARALVGGWS